MLSTASYAEERGIVVVGSETYKEKHQVPEEDRCRRISYQVAMFALTFFNYAMLHATRSAWSLATADLTKMYGFGVGVIADMNSTFLFFYAASGIFLGHLADKYRKNWVVFIQYTAIGIVQFSLGCLMFAPADKQKSFIATYFFLKVLDGMLQSFGWAVNFGLICNWFPRQGRGFLIGLWASCPSVGDIIGQQLYVAVTRNNPENMGYTFMILGGMIFVMALINIFFQVEFPSSKGVHIKEEGRILNPSELQRDQ